MTRDPSSTLKAGLALGRRLRSLAADLFDGDSNDNSIGALPEWAGALANSPLRNVPGTAWCLSRIETAGCVTDVMIVKAPRFTATKDGLPVIGLLIDAKPSNPHQPIGHVPFNSLSAIYGLTRGRYDGPRWFTTDLGRLSDHFQDARRLMDIAIAKQAMPAGHDEDLLDDLVNAGVRANVASADKTTTIGLTLVKTTRPAIIVLPFSTGGEDQSTSPLITTYLNVAVRSGHQIEVEIGPLRFNNSKEGPFAGYAKILPTLFA